MIQVPRRIGLIVNPIAGIGGRVGLKGSDGSAIQKRAAELGAVPESQDRAVQAVEQLRPVPRDLEIITYPAEMGEDAARRCGFQPTVIGSIRPQRTTPQDTINAATDMVRLEVDLLLFAGGDGTARDIYRAVGNRSRHSPGQEIPVLGIPAGVKIHSAVFAANPTSAGELARLYLQGQVSSLKEAEVMDIDETAYRQGIVSAKLHGYLRIPFRRRLIQSAKTPSGPGEEEAMRAIACDVIDDMEDRCLYIIGPGTTTRAITAGLGLSKTLVGVDVITARSPGRGELTAADVSESQLLQLIEPPNAKIIVTPIGGQGHIFGRGNQQLSPRVIDKVGLHNIIIVSTPEKLHSLHGRPLWVDTGDRTVDRILAGHIQVVTGYNERVVYRVVC